jgi:hypothetical protein
MWQNQLRSGPFHLAADNSNPNLAAVVIPQLS